MSLGKSRLINMQVPYNIPCPIGMDLEILSLWKLALNSKHFHKLCHHAPLIKGSQVLRTVDDRYSTVGVLCELYNILEGTDYWTKTSFGYEWKGIYLGRCPREIIEWAWHPKLNKDLIYITEDSICPAKFKSVDDYLFWFDNYYDSKRQFPTNKCMQRVFSGKAKARPLNGGQVGLNAEIFKETGKVNKNG